MALSCEGSAREDYAKGFTNAKTRGRVGNALTGSGGGLDNHRSNGPADCADRQRAGAFCCGCRLRIAGADARRIAHPQEHRVHRHRIKRADVPAGGGGWNPNVSGQCIGRGSVATGRDRASDVRGPDGPERRGGVGGNTHYPASERRRVHYRALLVHFDRVGSGAARRAIRASSPSRLSPVSWKGSPRS